MLKQIIGGQTMKRKVWILSLVVLSISLFAFSSNTENDEKIKVSVIHQDGNKVIVLDTLFDPASGYTVEQFLLDNNLDPDNTEIIDTDNFNGVYTSEISQGIWFMDESHQMKCNPIGKELVLVLEDEEASGDNKVKILKSIDENGNASVQKWVNDQEGEGTGDEIILDLDGNSNLVFIHEDDSKNSENGEEKEIRIEKTIGNGEEVTHIWVNGEEVDPEDFDGNLGGEGMEQSIVKVIKMEGAENMEEMNVEVETSIENGEEVTHIFVNGEEVDPENFDGEIFIHEGTNPKVEVIHLGEGESHDIEGLEMNVEVETTVENGEEVTHIFVNGEEVDPEDFEGNLFIHGGGEGDAQIEIIVEEIESNTNDDDTKSRVIRKEYIGMPAYTIAIVSRLGGDGVENKRSSTKEENLPISELKFSPNPNNGQFNLSFNLPEKGRTSITIHDIQGKVVYEENLGKFSGEYNQNIDLSSQGSGTYLLNLVQGKQNLVERVIVK